ncbi:hypothetical protein J6590_007045 [Homalodisca vitripennis]|nr:hypothetical protein J6590_007045 [Homalodisca vitripennis]
MDAFLRGTAADGEIGHLKARTVKPRVAEGSEYVVHVQLQTPAPAPVPVAAHLALIYRLCQITSGANTATALFKYGDRPTAAAVARSHVCQI